MPSPFAVLGTAIIAHLGASAAITVTRTAAGGYNPATGVYDGGAVSTFDVDAHVQPASPKELLQLPENERTRESIAIYTSDLLRTSDVTAQTIADIVTWQGADWRVVRVENWTPQARYSKAIAQRVTE